MAYHTFTHMSLPTPSPHFSHQYTSFIADRDPRKPLKKPSCPCRYEIWISYKAGATPNPHMGQCDEHGTLRPRGSTCDPRECRQTAKLLAASAVCTRWRNPLWRLLSFRTRLSAFATKPRCTGTLGSLSGFGSCMPMPRPGGSH